MDYLTRLIQRTTGTGPAVQPLLRSRYAPEDGKALPPEELVDEVAAEAPSPPSGVLREPARAAPPDTQPSHVLMEDPKREAAVGVVPEATEESVSAATVTPVEVKNGSPIAQRPPVPEPEVTERVSGLDAMPPPRVPTSDSMEGPEPILPGEPRNSVSDPVETLLVPSGAVEEPAGLAPPAATPPKVPRNGRGEPEAEAPVVRVTIGRIDVRTAPPSKPAPPAPRAAPAAPRLGLDEYLRNGGRG